MRANKQLAKKLNRRFAEKQDELDRRPAVMGDGAGNLYVTGFDNFVYVTMGDKAVPVFNNRVPPQTGLQVWVGYAAEEPTLFQVLATRSESPAGVQTGFVGYAPARRYEWMARNGGQDPLSVHLRAFTPLKLSVSPEGWMFVDLYRGFVYSGGAYIVVPRQTVDLYAQIPTTAGKAAFVLITIDTSGAVVQTKGSEVDIDVLAITDIPAIPASTAFVCGAVRVYYGQLEIQEGRTNTDFVDLRFPGYAGGGLWQPLDADLTAIAALTPANDDVIQRKAGAWANRTISQLVTDLQTVTDTLYIANSLLTTRGDIITRSATIPQRLALGAAGSFLRSDGTDVVWSTGLLAITASKTLTVANSLTLSGTDGESLVLTKGLTVTTNAGTIAFSAAASTLTVPQSMVSAGRDVANTFTAAQTISDTTQPSGPATGALIVAGGASIAKNLWVGSTTLDATIAFLSGTGKNGDMQWYKYNGTGIYVRWILRNDLTAESGADAGSNMALSARNDAGGNIGNVFSIVRATRVFTFELTTDATSPTAGAVNFVGGVGIAKALYVGTSILSVGATAGIGYATGAGGTVTQATNKATGVTLNKVTGLITLNNAALAANTTVTFTLTNSAIAATDTIILQHNSGGTVGAYTITAQPAAGSATINVRNVTAGSLSEAIVIRYTVIKSISA